MIDKTDFFFDVLRFCAAAIACTGELAFKVLVILACVRYLGLF